MKDSLSEVFGLVVRRRREGQGISQEELAAQAGIHRTYISSIELGKVRLGLEIAKKIANGLGIPLAALIAESENERPGGRRKK